MKVLVTGGAGYIGSHTVRELRDAGHSVLVLDDLSKGHRLALPDDVVLLKADLSAAASLPETDGVEVVLHFAGLLSVAESSVDPGSYYRVNVVKAIQFLDAMVSRGVQRFVLSSTCAVYGMPVRVPMDEEHPQAPINPYGATKRAFERALSDYAAAGRIQAVALRYFNAAGCHPDGSLGEDHLPEEHLIPLAIDAALGRRPPLTIYGDDYQTPDGTCIRDYIHVTDLARAHVLALAAPKAPFLAYNLGTEKGHSVKQVLEAVGRVARRPVPARVGSRRPGDPPRLVASSLRARTDLGFQPELGTLETIVETALRWRVDHPRGYGSRP